MGGGKADGRFAGYVYGQCGKGRASLWPLRSARGSRAEKPGGSGIRRGGGTWARPPRARVMYEFRRCGRGVFREGGGPRTAGAAKTERRPTDDGEHARGRGRAGTPGGRSSVRTEDVRPWYGVYPFEGGLVTVADRGALATASSPTRNERWVKDDRLVIRRARNGSVRAEGRRTVDTQAVGRLTALQVPKTLFAGTPRKMRELREKHSRKRSKFPAWNISNAEGPRV